MSLEKDGIPRAFFSSNSLVLRNHLNRALNSFTLQILSSYYCKVVEESFRVSYSLIIRFKTIAAAISTFKFSGKRSKE
jgi:hypothetical protein